MMAGVMTEHARLLIQVECDKCKRSLPGALIRWDPPTDSAGVTGECHGTTQTAMVGRDLLEDAESVGRPVTVSLFGEDGGRVIPAVQTDEPLRVPVVLGGSYPDESSRERRRRLREAVKEAERSMGRLVDRDVSPNTYALGAQEAQRRELEPVAPHMVDAFEESEAERRKKEAIEAVNRDISAGRLLIPSAGLRSGKSTAALELPRSYLDEACDGLREHGGDPDAVIADAIAREDMSAYREGNEVTMTDLDGTVTHGRVTGSGPGRVAVRFERETDFAEVPTEPGRWEGLGVPAPTTESPEPGACRIPWCERPRGWGSLCAVHRESDERAIRTEGGFSEATDAAPDVTPKLTIHCEGDWE